MSSDAHPFDSLNRWVRCSEEELKGVYSLDAVALLSDASRLLRDQPLRQEEAADIRSFAVTCQQLHQVLVTGARELGSALIEASELVEAGQRDAARQVYEEFIRGSTSSFHRRIAENQLRRLNLGGRT